jgi:MFS family permease
MLAAGFLTAFGAHAIAANLGRYATGRHASLLELGVLLALYDGAEVLLKPAFGALADRIGARPVLLGGLLGFAAASAGFVLAGEPDALAAARLAQGAAAAAFSPAASALIARFSPTTRRGRAFGSYGTWKGLGYTTGPLLGGGLITLGGFGLLFAVLAALGLGVAGWAALALPAAPPLPRARQTVLGLARRLAQPSFLHPVLALAGATAALSAGVGFLPVRGAQAGLGPLATGAAASLLALAAALVQPRAGRAHDRGRLPAPTGMAAVPAIWSPVTQTRSGPHAYMAAGDTDPSTRSNGTLAVPEVLLALQPQFAVLSLAVGASIGPAEPIQFGGSAPTWARVVPVSTRPLRILLPRSRSTSRTKDLRLSCSSPSHERRPWPIPQGCEGSG